MSHHDSRVQFYFHFTDITFDRSRNVVEMPEHSMSVSWHLLQFEVSSRTPRSTIGIMNYSLDSVN